MAAPTVIQALFVATGNNTTENLAGTVGSFNAAVTAGSTVVMFLGETSGNPRTQTVVDDVDGAWAALPVANNSSRTCQIWYLEGHTGGTVTITVASNFACMKNCAYFELSACVLDQNSEISAASTSVDATNGYPCSADATVIDTGTDPFIVSGMVTTANAGTLTASSGYTALGSAAGYHLSQYGTFSGARTNERGWVNEAGTNRNFCGAIASFVVSGGGGGATIPIFEKHYRSMRG